MPRSLIRDVDKEQDCIIRGSIKNLLEIRQTTVPVLATKTGMKESTLYAKIRNPSKFNIRELRKVYKALQMTDEEKERLAREAM